MNMHSSIMTTMKAFLLFLSLGSLLPANTGSDLLTVRKAITLAIENNPELNRLKEELDTKNGEWLSSFGLYSPRLSFLKEGIDPNGGGSFLEKRWAITQPIDFPLKTYYRLNRISNEEAALKAQVLAGEKNLIAEVKSKYISVLYASDLLALVDEQINISEDLLRAVKSKLEAGESSELDLMKVELILADNMNNRDEATRLYHKSRYELFKSIGLDPEEQSYSTSFGDSLVFFDLGIDQEAVLDKLSEQPEYLSISMKVEATEDMIGEAWSSILPDLDFSYYVQDFGSGFNYRGFELGIKVPLWFLLNENGRIKMAKSYKRQNEWIQRDTYLEMKKRIEVAWHSYETSLNTIKRYDETIRQKSIMLKNLTMEGFTIGQVDLLNSLDAQRTYLSSQKRYLDALQDYYLQLVELEKYWNTEIVFREK